ncbi:MAG: hypothetical protein A2Z02_04845 [Chloroflexi bacterium RBG_16_48_7]|nr:MAG: hypothetical protein A2Z02_04845 [Chloroflexi bacterium RBG_16_48_7]
MSKIKVGDKVKVKGPSNWPTPPGYRFANAEGTVIRWSLYDDVMDDFKDFAYIHIEKADGDGKVYVGDNLLFKVESLDKI